MIRLFHLIVVTSVVLCASRIAGAQEIEDPAEAARFHLGPLRFTPSVMMTNVGFDNNVFNEVQDPKRDMTTAIGPAVDLWLKVGPSRFSGKASGQYLYYKDYESQRSWNNRGEGRWEVPLSRLQPFVTGSYANTRERPGFEIDSRAQRRDDSVGLGTEVRFGSRTSLIVGAKRSRLAFDQDETFFGASLAAALNRTSDAAEVTLHYQLTPLTTFTVNAGGSADRFSLDPIRNSDSIKVVSGFELKPVALISGKALIGYRRFNALDPGVPDYTGLVAAVDATYTVSVTRLAVKVNRDLDYSYEPVQPYYALTDIVVSATERVTHAWDIVARGGWQSLAYSQLVSATPLPDRVDKTRLYGAGIGYWVGEILRIGVDANYYQRTSDTLTQHGYEGLRVGASFSYGLPQ